MLKIILLLSLLIIFFDAQFNVYAAGPQNKLQSADTLSVSSGEYTKSGVNNYDKPEWYSMFTDLPADYYHFFRTTFSVRNIPSLIPFAVFTGSFIMVDQAGWRFDRGLYNRSQVIRKTSDITVMMGEGGYQFLGAALFAASGFILRDNRAIKTGSNIAEAILSTGLFVQMLKRITGRESPIASTESGGDWRPFPSIKEYQKHQPEYYSFPSGHLSTATAIFTVIANNYPDVKWIKPVGYPLLGLLSISLVNKGMHWYSDLPLAYLLGYSFGNIIAPVRKTEAAGKEKTSLTILPEMDFNGPRLDLIFTF